jgi:outer membrane protein
MNNENQFIMKKTVLKIVFAAIIFLGACINVFAVEYRLDQLYKIALERSERIKISEEDVFVSEKNKDKAMSFLFPKLSGVGTYTGYKDRKIADSGAQTQPYDATSWSVRLDQTLSTSGRELTALKMAKNNIEKNKMDLFSVKETYMLLVTNAYYDVLKAGRLVEISQANIVRLIKYRDAASTRLKIGEVTKTAVLRAEAELSGAQSDLVKAENLFSSTKTVLQRIVGLEGDFDLYDVQKSASSDFKNIGNENKDPLNIQCPSSYLECLKDIAYNGRAELKSSAIQKNIAEQQVRYTRGAHWPILSLEGVFIAKHETPETGSIIRDNLYGGVRLTLPFFEGGLRQAETQEAMARKRQAEYALSDLKKSVSVEVENAYLDYIAQKGILKSSGDQVAFARDNYNAVSKQFDFGLAQSIEVMDANTVLVTAETQFIQALYNYQQSVIRLKRVTGTLLQSISDASVKSATMK